MNVQNIIQQERQEAFAPLCHMEAGPPFFSRHGGWRLWAVAFALFIFFHAPILWLKRASDVPQTQGKAAMPSIVFAPPTSEQMSADLSSLYEWIAVVPPYSGARPDYVHGFSHFAYPPFALTAATIPEFQLGTFLFPNRQPGRR